MCERQFPLFRSAGVREAGDSREKAGKGAKNYQTILCKPPVKLFLFQGVASIKIGPDGTYSQVDEVVTLKAAS